jgi:CDP-6-deoxy-D-xylo-4-hexulose-3-dehydrase
MGFLLLGPSLQGVQILQLVPHDVAQGHPVVLGIHVLLELLLLDVELGTYNIRADQIEDAITGKTKAIMVPHALGNPADLYTIMKVVKKYNLWFIEDNCDALGARFKGKLTGTFGHISTCSFYPAHHITMGEGGAVLTSDPLLQKIIASFRDWGRDCCAD